MSCYTVHNLPTPDLFPVPPKSRRPVPRGSWNLGNEEWRAVVILCGAVLDENRSRVSFEELALPLFDALYNYAHWLTHNREEAEDLVQETYRKALKGFSSFKPGTNFRAWIYRILRNTFLTSRTGLKIAAELSLDSVEGGDSLLPAVTETPESLFIENCDRQMVHDAIDALPPIFREAVLLCDVDGMSYQEIAETVGVPQGTVMSRLSRARNMLRLKLAKRLREA